MIETSNRVVGRMQHSMYSLHSLLGMLFLGLQLQDSVRATRDEGPDDRLVSERCEIAEVVRVAGRDELQDAAHDLTYQTCDSQLTVDAKATHLHVRVLTCTGYVYKYAE